MGLKKGQTNNPQGRPKGKGNKVTTETRQWINKLINDNRETLEADLLKLEPHQRWNVIEKLMQYTTPKMQSVEAKLDFSKLSDEDIDLIISEITKDV